MVSVIAKYKTGKRKEKMNLMKNVTNPAGDGGQSKRIEDIESAYANGAINHDQYEDLMSDEADTGNWIFVKRAGLAVLCLGIGILFLIS